MSKRIAFLAAVVLLGIAAAPAQAQQSLQALVNSATGSVIEVPAGEYQGPVRLKKGVLLVGAGADRTILNVPDAAPGVMGENRSGILGFTIRGGQHGVRTLGHFMGVFECRLEGQAQAAVLFEGGSGVAVNNAIVGTQTNQGVLILRSNPLVARNVIADHGIGVHVSGEMIPPVQDNLFIGNRVAVLVDPGSKALLARNLYDRNGVAVQGADLGADDRIEPIAWDGKVPATGSTAAQYRDLMNVVFEEAINAHPVVVYGLGEEMGAFDVVILSPSATFSIGASAVDTIISSHHAYDSATQDALASTLRIAERPFVDVVNPLVKDLAIDRYVLENRYRHPASYGVNEKGQRLFRRMTNMNRVEIYCPAGWLPVGVNYPASFDRVGTQVVIRITHPGVTNLEIAMEPDAVSADPLGVRAALSGE
ncbi:MAG: hypothetical protein KA248_02540 [Kiritimatiellae bacterium]|nr:hypothetical protein [Kiritimatiellia bacterium]